MGESHINDNERVIDKQKEFIEKITKAQSGNQYYIDQLFIENTGLINSIVNKFKNINYEREDLFQIGSIGLIKAINKFDISYNVKFSTYAVPLIMGEIKKFIRDDGKIKVSRSIKSNIKKIKQAEEKLQKSLGRSPTISEISEETQVDKDDIIIALDANIQMNYIENIYDEKDKDVLPLVEKVEDKKNKNINDFDKVILIEIIKQLNSRERQIIILRYFKDMTQSEVAKMIGISQVQVSRLEKNILDKLKQQMTA